MKYFLIRENIITNGRFVETNAIQWTGEPIPILDPKTSTPIGSLKSIIRDGDSVYGSTDDFDQDVDLAIYIDKIKSTQKDNILHIKSGHLRHVMIELKEGNGTLPPSAKGCKGA